MKALVIVAAGLLGAALALYPMAVAGRPYPMLVFGGPALLALALSLIAADWTLVGPGVGLIVIEYAVALSIAEGPIDPFAPVFGAGALLLLELVDVSAAQRESTEDANVVFAHARNVLLFVAAGAAVAATSLIAARVVRGGSEWSLTLAAACAAGGLLAALASARFALRRGAA